MNWYNENDPHAAAWLRELIARKLIPDGVVDERSITEINASDLAVFTQCHFFAGIAGWPLALRLAGWPEDRRVWTGSCPCQPFSAAGKGEGKEDERHLWPVFFGLIEACRPPVVFGEQVASALVVGKAGGRHREEDGPVWLDGVFADLESAGYTTGAAVLGAHSVGAPHIRQRLYWLAESEGQQPHGSGDAGRRGRQLADGRRLGDARGEGLEGYCGDGDGGSEPGRIDSKSVGSTAEAGDTGGGLGNSASRGLGVIGDASRQGSGGHADGSVVDCRMADPDGRDTGSERKPRSGQQRLLAQGGLGNWENSYWHPCRDGKHRRVPVEPELFPLVDAGVYLVPGMARRRTVRPPILRGSGNAICSETAKVFIEAYLDLNP